MVQLYRLAVPKVVLERHVYSARTHELDGFCPAKLVGDGAIYCFLRMGSEASLVQWRHLYCMHICNTQFSVQVTWTCVGSLRCHVPTFIEIHDSITPLVPDTTSRLDTCSIGSEFTIY